MHNHCTIPLGLCQCGCGRQTKLADRNSTALGWVKNQPTRFVNGHRCLPLIDRFWANVVKGTETDACWQWLGTTNRDGYGVIMGHNRRMLAHRVSWEIHNGPIPEGMEVCHKCDNPPCPNPLHLFLGTQADNMADARDKGRSYNPPRMVGPKHPRSKITAEIVREIRDRYPKRSCTAPVFAKEYGLSLGGLKSVINRQSWKHVP